MSVKSLDSDITIIGGGPGGYVAAIKAAQMGANVVLIEKNKLGGTCLNWGCIPTKALVRTSEVYKLLKNATVFGCEADNVTYNMRKINKKKDQVVKHLVKGINYLLKKNKVKVLKGIGKIEDKNTVSVITDINNYEINSKNIIIATGSKPVQLPIEGAGLPGVINSKQALSLNKLPESMVIIGGGVIGMEFAFIFRTFGVKVTVVEYLDSLLPASVDKDVARELTGYAKKDKINVLTGCRVEKIKQGTNKDYNVLYDHDGEKKSVSGEKVLMAVGRKPFFEGAGVKELGIELNENDRGIKVNRKMETNISNIYAIGDVTNEILLAHVASHQGVVAVKNIMGEESEIDYKAIPSAIFTDPEIATVGIDERTAKEANIEVDIGKFPFAANGKVLTTGDSRGFIKIIKNKKTGRVIGSSIIGIHATDLISELTLAIQNGLTTREIVETVHPHPTTSEVIHEAALQVEDGAFHI